MALLFLVCKSAWSAINSTKAESSACDQLALGFFAFGDKRDFSGLPWPDKLLLKFLEILIVLMDF